MLPPLQRQRYQDFQQALAQLHANCTTTDLDVVALRDKFQDLQKLFQSQIINLSPDDIEPDSSYRWQSLQTEIYKQMRLLETDLMLLQSSRSSATTLARASRVSDRINTLIQYCQALLQL